MPMAEISAPLQITESGSRRRQTSTTFVVALSTILGIVIAAGAILGVMGNAFYVSRSEYTQKTLNEAQEAATVKYTLERVEKSLTRQEQAFEKLSDVVQTIKMDMPRKK
jgi:hypothetical protein